MQPVLYLVCRLHSLSECGIHNMYIMKDLYLTGELLLCSIILFFSL